jgi:hypothetical protein
VNSEQVEIVGESAHNPFAIAAGLLRNDLHLLIPLFLILALPALIDVYAASIGFSSRFGLVGLDRIVQIAVVVFIVLRWRARFQSQGGPKVRALPVAARIAAVGIGASLVLTTPFLGLAVSRDSISLIAFVGLAVLGCIWCLRVHLFFAVAGVLGLSIGPSFARAVDLARGRMKAIIGTLVLPIAATLLITAILSMPYPDGRSLVWLAAAASAEGLFWILSTYTALGLAVTLFKATDWRAAGLDHYRAQRLKTLELQGGKTLPKILAPKFGACILGVALCFAGGNLLRHLKQPPAAKVEIRNVAFADYKLRIELALEDREFKYRGFQPAAFSVASKNGFQRVEGIESLSEQPDKKEIVGMISSKDGAPTTLYLSFSSSKTESALRAMDNLWLWYKLTPILPLMPASAGGTASTSAR